MNKAMELKTKHLLQDIKLIRSRKHKLQNYTEEFKYNVRTLMSYIDFAKINNPDHYLLMTVYFELLLEFMFVDLYFNDILKSSNKEINKHMDKFPELISGEENKILQEQFLKYYDVIHPVRNSLETIEFLYGIEYISKLIISRKEIKTWK